MSDFVYNKNKISSVKRVRILENRDLKKGLRLNRNERVDNYPIGIYKKIFANVNDYDLGKYPDQSKIYKLLSIFLKLNEKNFIISSGIDGSIKSIFEIFTDIGDKIGLLHPTYAMYEVYSNIFKTKLIKVKYSNFKLDRNNLYKIIKSKKIKILFIPNPNQPIEDIISLKEMKKICSLCKKNKILLVVDEAYFMFGSPTAASLCKKNENLIVLRTLSKSFGLPSVRFGYVIGHEKIIKIFQSYRLAYESNFFTDKVVEYFLKNFSIISNYISKVQEGRNFLKKEVEKLNFKVIGEKSNFLLIDFKSQFMLKKILKKFKQKKIYVKSNYKGELMNCILVTCGEKKTMKKFLKIITQAIKK